VRPGRNIGALRYVTLKCFAERHKMPQTFNLTQLPQLRRTQAAFI
jgi:hypothetical protein